MTPLETLLLVSFAMLTCLQTTLTWLNSRIRRGLIALRWPVATWEPIIGGHAQCVWRNICISLPLSLWGDGTLLAGTLAASTVGTSCIYLFLPYIFCVCLPVQITLSNSSLYVFLSELALINLPLSCVLPKSSAGGQTEPEDYRNDAGLLCMKLFAIKSVDTTTYS